MWFGKQMMARGKWKGKFLWHSWRGIRKLKRESSSRSKKWSRDSKQPPKSSISRLKPRSSSSGSKLKKTNSIKGKWLSKTKQQGLRLSRRSEQLSRDGKMCRGSS
jgi:hypothetical protein